MNQTISKTSDESRRIRLERVRTQRIRPDQTGHIIIFPEFPSEMTEHCKEFPDSADLRIADSNTKVYKDECVLCFRDAEDQGGLYVNMRTFRAYCEEHVPSNSINTDIYLVVKAKRVEKPEEKGKSLVVDKLAFGTEGGFQVDDGTSYELLKEYEIVYNSARFPLADGSGDLAGLPEHVRVAAEAIKGHDGIKTQQASTEAWEETREVSSYALGMEQMPCTRKVPTNPKAWKCDDSGETENLWLNLHDGHIGSGRPQWDGSGGNGAAMRHYQEMKAEGKNFPLVVKLGTITPAGADVYSYASDEDDMVIDPELGNHLAHWGINILQMQKTEKTMNELQIDKNVNFEFDLITEAGKDLEVIKGRPGLMGLRNLGNSCYINSVLQVLCEFCEGSKCTEGEELELKRQYMKLRMALLEKDGCGKNSQDAVEPWMFKRACGEKNRLWAGGAQQDAHEFLCWMIEALGQEKDFEVGMRTRIQCPESKRVSQSVEQSLGLSLDICGCSKNKRVREESEGGAKNLLTLAECLDWNYRREELVDGYYSSYLKKHVTGLRTIGMTEFPKYLVVHLRRYYVDEDWTPKKLQVELDIPDKLSLANYKVSDEKEDILMQPDDEGEIPVNSEHLASLIGMGFGSEDATYALREHNNDVERAMEFLLNGGKAIQEEGSGDVSEESIAMICSMGFGAEQARLALRKANGNVEAALELVLSGAPLEPEAREEVTAAGRQSSEYELTGFLSHIGANLSSGHYVAHIKKEDDWFIANDDKLAKSKALPKHLAYVLVYKQV
jgi:ubiquitin carboxyl-terminal hydrolase 5/13